MSETMSSTSNDWANFYQRNQAGTNHHQAALFTDNPPSAAAATVTSTNSTNSTTSSTRLNPEGRVSKPIRRRSRASRRTPTTLLNTDTANFRAMVQQFTGCPAASFPSGASSGLYPSGANFSFGLGPAGQQLVNNSNIVPRGGGYNILQIQQPQQQQLLLLLQQQQQQQHMFSLNNNNNNNASNHDADHSAFLDMLQSSRVLAPTMEGTSSYVPPIRSSSNKNANDRG